MRVVTPARSHDDLALARRCVEGDRSAQRELFHRERRRVHAILFRILGSNSHMDDLVQEAFLNVFRSLGSYRGEASLGTWVDRCTVRVAYAHLSANRRARARLDLVVETSASDVDAERRAAAREATRKLYDVLDEMDPKMRTAFALHELEGKPMSEVASLMDATLVATKARVWRARRLLEKRAAAEPALRSFLEEEP